MKQLAALSIFLFLFCWHAPCAFAHFGIIIPSESMVMDKASSELKLDIGFIHPFAQQSMDMQKPLQFFVMRDGQKTPLEDRLKQTEYWGKKAWECSYKIDKPGVYAFAAIPAPYFEPAEDSFIIHYAKTVVGAYGEEDGWDKPIGTPVEIVPLIRPFGNYAGNVFYGQALADGKPLANAMVEVENLNRKKLHEAPNAYFETQVVKTDSNGIFMFGIPWAGWWGFAVLHDSPEKIKLGDETKKVELGGILWMQFLEPRLSQNSKPDDKMPNNGAN